MLSAVAAPAVRGWLATLRVFTLHRGLLKPGAQWSCGRELYAVTERDLLAVLPFTRRFRFLTMIAKGRDGDYASGVAERLGCVVIRGSSRRGGEEAGIAFSKALESWDGPAVISIDGPLGPAGVVKPGAILLAAGSGRPLRVVAGASSRAFRIPRSWASMEIPLPFSRVVIAAADARTYPMPIGRQDIEREAARIEAELRALRQFAIAAPRTNRPPAEPARAETR